MQNYLCSHILSPLNKTLKGLFVVIILFLSLSFIGLKIVVFVISILALETKQGIRVKSEAKAMRMVRRGE
jgi:hypothetical protein